MRFDSIAKTAAVGGDRVFRSGAPRSMKMGTIASPWRYDPAATSRLSSISTGRSPSACVVKVSRMEKTTRIPERVKGGPRSLLVLHLSSIPLDNDFRQLKHGTINGRHVV